jgi:hypothetical protein
VCALCGKRGQEQYLRVVTYVADENFSHLANSASFSNGRCHGLCRLFTIAILRSIREIGWYTALTREKARCYAVLLIIRKAGHVVDIFLALHEN